MSSETKTEDRNGKYRCLPSYRAAHMSPQRETSRNQAVSGVAASLHHPTRGTGQHCRARASTRQVNSKSLLQETKGSIRNLERRTHRALSQGDAPILPQVPVKADLKLSPSVGATCPTLAGHCIPQVVRESSNEGSSASSGGTRTPRSHSRRLAPPGGGSTAGHSESKSKSRAASSAQGSDFGNGGGSEKPPEGETHQVAATIPPKLPPAAQASSSYSHHRSRSGELAAIASHRASDGTGRADGSKNRATARGKRRRDRLWSEASAPVLRGEACASASVALELGLGLGLESKLRAGSAGTDGVHGAVVSTDAEPGRWVSDADVQLERSFDLTEQRGAFGSGSVSAASEIGESAPAQVGLDIEFHGEMDGMEYGSPGRLGRGADGEVLVGSGCSVRSIAARSRTRSHAGRPRLGSGRVSVASSAVLSSRGREVEGLRRQGSSTEDAASVGSSELEGGSQRGDDSDSEADKADQRDLLRPGRLLRDRDEKASSMLLWQQQWRRAVGIVLAAIFVLIIAAYSGARLAADYQRRLIASHEGRALRVCSHRGRGLQQWPAGMGKGEPAAPGLIPLLLRSQAGTTMPPGEERREMQGGQDVEFWAPSLLTHMYALLRGEFANRPPGEADLLTGATSGVSCFDVDVTPVRKEWLARLERLHEEIFSDGAPEADGGAGEGEQDDDGDAADDDFLEALLDTTDGGTAGSNADANAGGGGDDASGELVADGDTGRRQLRMGSSVEHVRLRGMPSEELWREIESSRGGRSLSGRRVTGGYSGGSTGSSEPCDDSFVPGEQFEQVKRFACLAEAWLGAWQPTAADETEDQQSSHQSGEDPLEIVNGKTHGQTAKVVLLAVHPSEMVRIGSITAQAAAAARHGGSALLRLQARASVGPSAGPPTLAQLLRFLNTPRVDASQLQAPATERQERRLSVTGQLPGPPPFDSGLTTKRPQMLVTLELKSANDVYAELMYEAVAARSAGMLTARSRAGVFAVETSFDVMRRRRRAEDSVGMAAALPDLPLPAPASAQVCAAATAIHEREEEQKAAALAQEQGQEEENQQGDSGGARLLRFQTSSVYDWLSDGSGGSSGTAGYGEDAGAQSARQELIDAVVGPMLDGSVQVVMPSVNMLRTCGEPLRVAAPQARSMGIPLPITAWTVDDVETACELWLYHGATGVVSNRAGMMAAAVASGACDEMAKIAEANSGEGEPM